MRIFGGSDPKRRRTPRMSLPAFFLGQVTILCREEDLAALLTLMMRHRLAYSSLTFTGDGAAYFTASYAVSARILYLCRRHGIGAEAVKRRGIVEAIRFGLSRPGLPIGLVLAVLLTILASGRLWEIRVTGNSTLPSGAVIRELQAAGLSVGDLTREIDVDAIENRLLRDSERISWITVNLIGTVAEVQIREKLTPDRGDPEKSPANLVARSDGVIVGCEIERGNLLVKKGMAVRKGELLVSGIYESTASGLRFARAAGVIYAETAHTFEISVPFRHEVLTEDGEPEAGYTLSFFGREFTLKAAPDASDGAGAVERTLYLTVFGHELPIGIRCRAVQAYRTEEAYYTPERAMEIAYYRLSREIAAIPGMQGLLSKSITSEWTEDGYRLICHITCIENIAQTKNIEIALLD